MKKLFILLGIVLLNGMFFSCSNDDQELNSYVEEIEVLNTGGEDGYIPPPPPPPTQN